MAINPDNITTIRVDQLADDTLGLTDKFPHTVGTELKSSTIQELVDLVAAAVGVGSGVGYLPISVTDGQQLPDVPTDPSFFLAGTGTYLNINGFPNLICTENLNAIMSLADHWEIAVEIPINPLSGTVQSVTGTAVDNTDPLNPVINTTGGGAVDSVNGQTGVVSIDLESVLTEGNESIMPIVITDTVNSATLDKTLIELNDISTSNQVGFNTSGYYYINPTDGKTITINSSGFLVNNSVYNSEEITNNSIVYPLPTGATSQIATLLDIPSPITIDATPTDGSSNAVSSNGVFDALEERVRVIFSESADNATTATTAEQILSSKLISANTLKTNSVLKYIARIQRTNSNSSAIIKFYINTSNSLSGATQIGQGATMTSAILSQTIIRNFSLNSSSLLCGFPATQSSVSDYATTTNASFETTIDTTTDLYFITSVALNNASDIMTQRFNELTSSK